MMKQGRLGYNSSNGRYGLLASDLWIDTGFHCGEGLEVLVDDEWVQTRMEMNLADFFFCKWFFTKVLFFIRKLMVVQPCLCFFTTCTT